MAPEHEARTRAFYDHESEEPRRRRRPAADWGVGEDIFDRMPSRRFKRADRRAEHREDATPTRAATTDDADFAGHIAVVADDARPARRPAASWAEDERDGAWVEAERRPAADDARGPRREDAYWDDDVAGSAAANVDSWIDDEARPLVPGESRTIVLGADGAPEPQPRRTVVISGHPDRLPAARQQRPPRTAVERIGASPDRIVAYAVALGFLLVLIAVLTTGQ